ncbi:MAG: hypothetical protein JST14_10930 [Bacteroidetes bacterium]|nr:hypothetical protein [Bacteroidota bacterium]MBS1978858.1 hypothetical protein [Bacteroidota bacterium]
MKEASPVKYYFAKYFFLAFGLLQWSCGMLLFLQRDIEKSRNAALVFFLTGLVCLILYFAIAHRFRRVAFGKNRIAVFSHDGIEHYEWPEVKWIKPVPYFNVYRLKLKGRKDKIYFLPDQNVAPLYGIFTGHSSVSELVKKRVK